jgi:hypothetical protein
MTKVTDPDGAVDDWAPAASGARPPIADEANASAPAMATARRVGPCRLLELNTFDLLDLWTSRPLGGHA